MKKVRYWIRNYFGFSETETKGFIIIMIAMFLILMLPFLLNQIISDSSLGNKNQQILNNLLADIDKKVSLQQQEFLVENDKPFREGNNKSKLFYFDPNTASQAELESLGLKKYIIKNILKYRSKGGFFKTKEKFSQVYGLSEKKYKELEPYIKINPKNKKARKNEYKNYAEDDKNINHNKGKKKKYTQPKIEVFDVNIANIEQLKQVKGIGDYYAKKIIKFRDALGGFYSVEQVRETYKLPEETATELLKYINLGNSNIKKLNINLSSTKDLAKHPYINWNLANAIIKFRKQHGNFEKIEDLKKIKILDTDTFNKVKHYVKV